jgi:hypothetical protein
MASTQAQKALETFEHFLASLDLESYQQKYRPIKTVEQDLPRELNPLPDLYEHYWKAFEDNPSFLGLEEFFDHWWEKRLRPLDEFIRKYFWGCSYAFVRLGLEARLYRTAVSIWTQFHFCYRWNASCKLPLEATPELDAQGIDALIHTSGSPTGIQIKKETYRSEARSENRFKEAKRHRPRRDSLHPADTRGARGQTGKSERRNLVRLHTPHSAPPSLQEVISPCPQ